MADHRDLGLPIESTSSAAATLNDDVAQLRSEREALMLEMQLCRQMVADVMSSMKNKHKTPQKIEPTLDMQDTTTKRSLSWWVPMNLFAFWTTFSGFLWRNFCLCTKQLFFLRRNF